MRVVVGVTGASGAAYAKRLLEELSSRAEVHLIVSRAGRQLVDYELGEGIEKHASCVFSDDDMSAPPASGSAGYDAMVVVPCSMKTLASIAHGVSDTLIARAADVILKQEKKLILVPRETPLNLVHLRNLVLAKEAGASILPASPGFYHKPKTIDDLTDFMAGKILELLGFDHSLYKKWEGSEG